MTMSDNMQVSEPGKVLKWWARLGKWPAGRLLFSWALGWLAPYSSTIGARVEVIKPGYARVSMRDRRAVRNHLQSIHAISLVNLGEIATGLAVLSTISANMRGIVLSIHADYLKKARGKLVAVAEFELPATLDENTPYEVAARLQDQSGEVVTIVKASWLIGYKPT